MTVGIVLIALTIFLVASIRIALLGSLKITSISLLVRLHFLVLTLKKKISIMVKYDIHYFSVDALPLVLQFLNDSGFKVCSHKSSSPGQVRFVENYCPDNCVRLKVKYHV